MIPNRSGVIMTVTTLHSRTGLLLVGGYGPAMAAKEALTRELSAELAPHGIRVVGLRPNAIPEAKATGAAFASRAGDGTDAGTVPRAARQPDPPAPVDDARRGGRRGGLHGVGQGERDDRDHCQLDHGQPGRLTHPLLSVGIGPFRPIPTDRTGKIEVMTAHRLLVTSTLIATAAMATGSFVDAGRSRPDIDLEFLGQQIIPTGTQFEGTQFGGLSSLAYDAGRDASTPCPTIRA